MFTRIDVEKYFNSEKSLSLLFIIIGSIAIIAAIVFWFVIKSAIYKGIAVPLLLIAVIQLIVSIYVYKKADAQRIDVIYKLDSNGSFKTEKEIPRMETVIKNFTIYRSIEIVLMLIGLVLIFIYKSNPEKSFLVGIGIGLAIQAATMFAGDSYAARNANIYLEGLKVYKPTQMHL